MHPMSRRRESELGGCLIGAVGAQTRDRYADRESVWSSTEVSKFPPETYSHVGFSKPIHLAHPAVLPILLHLNAIIFSRLCFFSP